MFEFKSFVHFKADFIHSHMAHTCETDCPSLSLLLHSNNAITVINLYHEKLLQNVQDSTVTFSTYNSQLNSQSNLL